MGPTRRAVIDVGTNSVKLLVAEVVGHSVNPISEQSEQTRLGRGFYESHRLRPEAIADTASVVAQFTGLARARNAQSLRIIATSAARDAVNKDELLSAIKRASGLEVDVISGEEEAELVYQGVRSDPKFEGQRLLILDVGGGSSEFIIGRSEHPELARSFPLGSVRLLEQIRPSDPPALKELRRCREHLHSFFASHVLPELGPALASPGEPIRLVGTGGTASILARMEFALDKYQRDEIERLPIALASLHRWMKRIWSMPLSERRAIIGLPKKRADVILTGLAIYEAVLQELGFAELQASTRGLRFAAVTRPASPPAFF